jgi:hypothetical protein
MAVNIVSISPITGAIGVQLHEAVEIIFSTSVDPTTVGIGTLFVEGSDKEVQSGPLVPINFQGTSDVSTFKDPAYYGLVQGTYEYEYLSTDGVTPLPNQMDTSGTEPYYTKFTFQPIRPFSPLHPYKVYVVGTATDTDDLGIASRNVFDPIADGGNSGNGSIVPHGGYRGTVAGTFTINFPQGGVVGDATYRWKFNSGSFNPVALTHTHKRSLQDNVSISFSPEGTFQAGDQYTFLVKPKTYLAGIQISNFVTGDYGTQVLPNDTSSIISRVAPPFPGAVAEPGLALDHTLPYNLDCNIDPLTQSFAFYFNKSLDPVFDTHGMRVYIGPANGDTCIRPETSFTPNNVFVEDGTCLRVYIQSPVPVDGFGFQVYGTDV